MTKYGIVIHVHHLETVDWNKIVWGDPVHDQLGTLTKFVDCLLDISANDTVTSIIYSGPSSRDGLSEGDYTKRYLMDRLDLLQEFPRLQRKLDRLSSAEYDLLMRRIQDLEVGRQLRNTMDEVASAAAHFAEAGATRVLQVAPINHAPRCLKLQGAARAKGLIPLEQEWYMVMSDVCFAGSDPMGTAIAEQPHRPDDPVYGVYPALPEVLNRFYYELDAEHRIKALQGIARVVDKLAAEQAANADVAQMAPATATGAKL